MQSCLTPFLVCLASIFFVLESHFWYHVILDKHVRHFEDQDWTYISHLSIALSGYISQYTTLRFKHDNGEILCREQSPIFSGKEFPRKRR